MKKIANLLFAALIVAACSSVDLSPTDRYDKTFAFKNRENAERYLNYFYKEIYQFGQFGSHALGGSNANMSDGLTDILKYGGIVAGTGDCNLIMTVDGQQRTTQNYFDAWTTCYNWIRLINEFLDGLEENRSHFSQEEADRFKAEALFFRAWSYFLIMRCHASEKDDLGVIPYTDIKTMNADGKDHARANLSDSWDLIREDVDFAVSHLPERADSRGRLHRYAALALKARAMLYAGRYALAKAAVEEINTDGGYGYEEDYDDIFASLNSKEAIWGYGFISGVLTHQFDAKYSQPGDVCLNGNFGSGLAGPTQEFVDMFDNADGTPFDISDASRRFITPENAASRDPRLSKCILYNQAEWKGRRLECHEGGVDMKYMPYGSVNSPGNTVTGYYIRKLLDPSNKDFLVNGSYQPWIEFRYAEMQLIYAECCAWEKDYAKAWNTVNALRAARFGKEVYTAPINSWETALDVILKERAVELCFEGHRFWDLRRTGRAAQVLDGKKYSGVWWHPSGEGRFSPELIVCEMGPRIYPEHFDRFPIPQTEINNNRLAQQNSDW